MTVWVVLVSFARVRPNRGLAGGSCVGVEEENLTVGAGFVWGPGLPGS